MAGKYELIYFNSKGYAEPIRILFHLAGVKFTDTRLNRGDPQFAEALRSSPGACLPVLRVGDRVYCQSLAITRFVAQLSGYDGETANEKLMVNMFVETLYDLINRYDEVVKEQDPQRKDELKNVAYQTYFPRYLSLLEGMLSADNTFILNKMTWGDIVTMSFLELKQTREYGRVDLLSRFPKLRKQYEGVRGHESVTKWLETRPKTLK